MKRYLLLTLMILVFVSTVLTAETVLVFSCDQWVDGENSRGEEYVLPSLEDGIMEALFDAGHIVFNQQAPPLAEMRASSDLMRPSLLLAKNGGAQYMVEVEIIYDQQIDPPVALPERLNLMVTNVVNNDLLGEFSVLTRDFFEKEMTDMKKVCQLLGSKAAREVLGLL